MNDKSKTKQTRRILILGESVQHTEYILRVLVQNQSPRGPSVAKSIADYPVHQITTPYFSATVPVWTDEIGAPDKWAAQWQSEDGARDVVQAIGAWIVCFTKPMSSAEKDSLNDRLSTVSRVISHHLSSAGSNYSIDCMDVTDIVTLAVAIPSPSSRIGNADPSKTQTRDAEAEIEEICQNATGNRGDDHGAGLGWEYVDGTISPGSKLRNEFGETLGIDRLLDALKAGEWDLGQEASQDDNETESQVFGFEELSDEAGDEVDTRLKSSSEDELFGDFATVTGTSFDDPGGKDVSSLTFEDDFTDRPVSSRGINLSHGIGGIERAAGAEGDNIINQERAREMRASLLLNAEGIASEEGAEQLQQAAAAQTAASSSHQDSVVADGDDPWRVRGKGPSGPVPYETSMLGITSSGTEEANDEVEHLQSMMLKLQAARDLGADLPAAQRRQLAARAVREVMREI